MTVPLVVSAVGDVSDHSRVSLVPVPGIFLGCAHSFVSTYLVGACVHQCRHQSSGSLECIYDPFIGAHKI